MLNTILIISILSGIGALILINIVKKRAVKRDRERSFEIKIPLKTEYSDMEWELATLINIHRLDKVLDLNDTISTVCHEHSLNMASIFTASHENAGIRKVKLKKAIGIKLAGEIVAKGQRNAESILSMFLKSPAHRKKIEDPKWKEFGLSIEKGILRNYTTVIFTK